MIPSLVVALLLAPQVPKPPVWQWSRASFSAADLAKQVDKRLATLSNATLKYFWTYQKATVGKAGSPCQATIVGPNRFFVMMPNLDPRLHLALRTEFWIADGKHFGASIHPDLPKPGPLTSRPGVPVKVLNAWFSDFSRILLSGLGQSTQPLEKLVADAKRQGYAATADTRSIPYQGRTLTTHRMVLSKAKNRIEITVDPRGMLPVSIVNTVGTDNSRWSAVDWNLKPGKALNPLNCRFPTRGATKDIGPAPRRS